MKIKVFTCSICRNRVSKRQSVAGSSIGHSGRICRKHPEAERALTANRSVSGRRIADSRRSLVIEQVAKRAAEIMAEDPELPISSAMWAAGGTDLSPSEVDLIKSKCLSHLSRLTSLGSIQD